MSDIIEPPDEILVQYGRAFFWINWVEYLLELQIKELNSPPPSLNTKTLGQKLVIAKNQLPVGLYNKISKLNEDSRKLLAHGTIFQTITNLKTGKSEFAFSHKDRFEDIDEKLFEDMIILAKEIGGGLESLLGI